MPRGGKVQGKVQGKWQRSGVLAPGDSLRSVEDFGQPIVNDPERS